jgi:hypothetical protein
MSSTAQEMPTGFADINQFEAARTGNLAWFQHHKAAGILPTLLDNANYSLRYAAANDHLSVVRYLIEESGQSVDVAIRNNEAIRLAAENNQADVVRYLETVISIIEAFGLETL